MVFSIAGKGEEMVAWQVTFFVILGIFVCDERNVAAELLTLKFIALFAWVAGGELMLCQPG